MKAAYFKNRQISIVDVPVPLVSDSDALVQVALAGICSTDIELLQGYSGFEGIPGHEFVGVVRESPGSVDLVGRRVTADINVGCGQCGACRANHPYHCPYRRVIGIRGIEGAFAQYLLVPAANLHEVPDEVDSIEAVFSEPLAAALRIADQVHIRSHDRVAILGDGKMGLLTALALKHYGAQIVLIGKYPEKLAIAQNQGIAVFKVDPALLFSDTVAALEKFDIVVEATGSPAGINHALHLVRPQGTVILKTTSHEPSNVNVADAVVNELTLLGSRCGNIGFALQFLKQKRIDVLPLVESVYPFSDFIDAFNHAREKGSRKVLVAFE